jgi:hypothetical protein
MRISVIRTGGVAGMRREATIDTNRLDRQQSEEIHRLVRAADVAGLPEPAGAVKRGPDRFHYTLTIDEGEKRHAVSFEEERTPEKIRPLLEAVWRAADAGAPGAGPESG